MRRVGLIDITVGNAARLGASQRSTTRRCASHHVATQRASRWGHPATLARLARMVTLDCTKGPTLRPRGLNVRRRQYKNQQWHSLCLSEIKHAHTDDEVRQEMAWAKCDQNGMYCSRGRRAL